MSLDPVKVVTKINRSPSETFDAFMSKVSQWWPLDTHSVSPYLGEPAPESVVVERHEGGKIYEISAKGEHRMWGTLLDYQEGKRVSFSWHPGLPETEATTVSVEFELADDGKTIVTLVHSGWEARGDKAADIRGNYLTGWTDIIQARFTDFANAL
ncbi:MAG: SRPBCC domain-containing protein [Roseibium sp.]|uniref:SRPBCC domain-containing protein n=1 Tax=Roseibium sp. TaxID=1936156 RepID=UPI003D9C5EA5